MATIRVNLSKVTNACQQDETPAGIWPAAGWFAFLCNCDGTPFVRAGREYSAIPIDYGYTEIKDVPPGRYLLYAIVNPFQIGQSSSGIVWQANYASHFAIVDVCCGCKDVCVTLYNSGWHYCIQVIIYWFQMLSLQKKMNSKVAQNAIKAMTDALRSAGDTLASDAAINKQLAKITEQFTKQAKSKKG